MRNASTSTIFVNIVFMYIYCSRTDTEPVGNLFARCCHVAAKLCNALYFPVVLSCKHKCSTNITACYVPLLQEMMTNFTVA
jgi:hypothetical protein